MSKSRTINAVFEIQEDSDLAGVHFERDGKLIEWENLSRLEQIKMLNAWLNHSELFNRFLQHNEGILLE